MPRAVHPCEQKQDSEWSGDLAHNFFITLPFLFTRCYFNVVYRVDHSWTEISWGDMVSVLRRWISISRHTQIPQQSTQPSRTPTGRCGALSLEGIVAIRPPWREHAVAMYVCDERSVFWSNRWTFFFEVKKSVGPIPAQVAHRLPPPKSSRAYISSESF